MFDPLRFQTLLEAYLDLRLSGAERVEFEQMLAYSARAREEYWRQVRLHAVAREWGLEQAGRLAAEHLRGKPDTTGKPTLRKVMPWLLAALGVLVACGFVLRTVWQTESVPGTASDAIVGVIDEAAWAGGVTLQAGQGVPHKPLRLESGQVRLDFRNGARVWIHGPGAFRVVSGLQLELATGRARVLTPSTARGFAVLAGEVEFVDLGTEFGVIHEEGLAQGHVFEGSVEVKSHREKQKNLTLRAGEAVEVKNRQWISKSADSGAFPDPRVTRRGGKQGVKSPGKAPQGSLVQYEFIPNRNNVLRNTAQGADTKQGHGQIIGAEWKEGRTEGKWALKFGGHFSRVPFQMDQARWDAVTFVTWVKLEALPEQTTSLYTSQENDPGALSWSVDSTGKFRLELSHAAGEGSRWAVHASDASLDASLNQWMMLATSYDATTGQVRHYVNGRAAGDSVVRNPMKALLGKGQLASASHADGSAVMDKGNEETERAQSMQGLMDEFLILDRLVSPEEMKALYDAGKP